MEWGQPKYFQVLWALLGLLGIFCLSSWRKRWVLSKIGDLNIVSSFAGSVNTLGRWSKRFLVLIAIALIAVSLAQPHLRKKEITVEKKGVEIMIALDVSGSMLAKDIAPSRLEKAKLELGSMVDRFKQDKIGIVAFAGEAFIQCPLTLDKSAVKLFLRSISPSLVQLQGTSLSRALEVSLQAFGELKGDNRAIILLTDGEDHEGKALEIARLAEKSGVRIYTIGIGTAEGRTIPDDTGKGVKKDKFGKPVVSKLNEAILKQIAEISHGQYYRSSKGNLQVDAILYQLRQMSQKGFSKDKLYEYEENFQLPLLIGILLLLIEMLISERKDP